eukprot:scaffold29408_cov60-Attheya_sp.AAC.3
MPKTVAEAYEIDHITGTNNWTLAIEKEMRKIWELGAFEKWNKGTSEDLRPGKAKMPGNEEIGCHMVFDIKMDGKFTRKAQYVANNGNETEPPTAQTYASVVSRNSSSGASWRNMISQTMLDVGYKKTYADPDVWRRRAVKDDGTHYYELILVYVDNIMSISQIPQKTMDMIGKLYDLKDSVGEPE